MTESVNQCTPDDDLIPVLLDTQASEKAPESPPDPREDLYGLGGGQAIHIAPHFSAKGQSSEEVISNGIRSQLFRGIKSARTEILTISRYSIKDIHSHIEAHWKDREKIRFEGVQDLPNEQGGLIRRNTYVFDYPLEGKETHKFRLITQGKEIITFFELKESCWYIMPPPKDLANAIATILMNSYGEKLPAESKKFQKERTAIERIKIQLSEEPDLSKYFTVYDRLAGAREMLKPERKQRVRASELRILERKQDQNKPIPSKCEIDFYKVYEIFKAARVEFKRKQLVKNSGKV